jgi:hypothetical protein
MGTQIATRNFAYTNIACIIVITSNQQASSTAAAASKHLTSKAAPIPSRHKQHHQHQQVFIYQEQHALQEIKQHG